MPGLTLSREEKDAKHVYHLFPVLIEDRASFMNHMKSCGIETGIHYPRALHQLPAFEKYDFGETKFPVSEKLAAHGVSLPMYPTLGEADVEYIAQCIRSFFLSN
jgi:dTDP-4-amino-4,6-dideoxygalactose transaminase